MHTIRVNTPAVRTARRLLASIATNYNTAAEMDALFDAGEFSGPANARAFEAEVAAAFERVAFAYAMDPSELEYQHRAAIELECDIAMVRS